MAVYLDCAATTPLDRRIREVVLHFLDQEFGNAGSRTHDFGRRARTAVERARAQVAEAVGSSRGDVIFTSGATESNNLAILGLARHGESIGRKHIVSTQIEHHAVLEPLSELERRGFRVERVPPDASGAVDADTVQRAVGPDTLLVSIMHVNNETGVVQPIEEIAAGLQDPGIMLHVDAAQGFGGEIAVLSNARIDLLSISGHKIHAPKGIGALIVRRRHGTRPPLEPLMHGGGQEHGWRPGTLPVHLIAGLGKAAELALDEHDARMQCCREFRRKLLDGLAPLEPVINGAPERSVPHIVNLSFRHIDAETAIDAWRDLVAISHGAACTAQTYTCSHVLSAMGIPRWRQNGALRLSWCHVTEQPDLTAMVDAIERARQSSQSVLR